MSTLAEVLAAAQGAFVVALSVFGLHRGYLVWLHWRGRRALASDSRAPQDWPTLTVQLPLYNEPAVAARLLEAVARLDYPRDRLRVQVLDDSTDATTDLVAQTLRTLPREVRIAHLRRSDRTGYKAGALAHGLRQSDSELVAVFDADFVPPPDFLRALVPAFADPRVGMVQARWEHLNPDQSLLTAMQRLLLDGHFVIEHWARAANGRFFNFNGTAGIFRRACIDDAGGWEHDTLTEDLDLSYRAQLRGWRFAYRPDVVCPAELPARMNDFLMQQHRWAKGAIQTGRKLLGRLWRAPLRAHAKIEASFHLLGNLGFLCLLGLMLVTLPLQALRLRGYGAIPDWVRTLEGAPLALSLLCVLGHYGVAQYSLRRFGLDTLARLPVVLALGAGMTVNATAAMCAGLQRATGEFKRTPKLGSAAARSLTRNSRGALPWLEVGLGAWCATTATLSWRIDQGWTAAFHGLFAVGLLWAGGACLREDFAAAPQPESQASRA